MTLIIVRLTLLLLVLALLAGIQVHSAWGFLLALPPSPWTERRIRTYAFHINSNNNSNSNSNSNSNDNDINDHNCITITIPQYETSNDDHHAGTNNHPYPSPLHNIYIQSSLLSPSEAKNCLTLARNYATQSSCWNQGKDSIRHSAYATVDFPIEDCDVLVQYLNEIGFEERLWGLIVDKYGSTSSDNDGNDNSEVSTISVGDLSFEDFFCVHYKAKKSSNNNGGGEEEEQELQVFMDSLDFHRDGSLISFTIVLSESDDYVGGGTIFDALRDVVPVEQTEADPHQHQIQNQDQNKDPYGGVLSPNGTIRVKNPGDAVLHSGKILHGADVVSEGERIVIVGFVDVNERCLRNGVLKEACKEWGRCDVADNRFKRQKRKMSRAEYDGVGAAAGAAGWYTNNSKYLKRKSCMMNDFVPSLASVERRAEKEYQRLRRLRAEDVLLRNILLHRDERDERKEYEEQEMLGTSGIPDEIMARFGGDVTIL